MTDGTVETQAGRWLMAGLTQVAHWDEDAATNAVSDVESEARAAALREVASTFDLAVDKFNAATHDAPDSATLAAADLLIDTFTGYLDAILTEAIGASE